MSDSSLYQCLYCLLNDVTCLDRQPRSLKSKAVAAIKFKLFELPVNVQNSLIEVIPTGLEMRSESIEGMTVILCSPKLL